MFFFFFNGTTLKDNVISTKTMLPLNVHLFLKSLLVYQKENRDSKTLEIKHRTCFVNCAAHISNKDVTVKLCEISNILFACVHFGYTV